jgi:hypothetical protein
VTALDSTVSECFFTKQATALQHDFSIATFSLKHQRSKRSQSSSCQEDWLMNRVTKEEFIAGGLNEVY